MLEGVVARLLNQLLGKYVVDLDTENLNVGIFSGQVQLTDLKLKAEALFELNLPVQVKVGTIGKMWLQIPWNSLWSQPVVINVEDILIVAEPVVTSDTYDQEKDKRLTRALKRKVLADLEDETELIGGPSSFSEHLMTHIINNLQLNVTNVHIRYEDAASTSQALACGLCLGSITAETTNCKWKASKNVKNSCTSYYLVKIEALSAYWNPKYKITKWDLPSQYYSWRNTMSTSLQHYSMDNQDFEFLIKPMTTKVKMTISKSQNGNITKVVSDVVIQDCNIQVSQDQYQSILAVNDSMSRMSISWKFLSLRPNRKVMEDKRCWWKYAYEALLEQRVRPYTWSRIKTVREHYKQYAETFKKIILNPNDTELKMDLQKYEDNLSIISIIIARRQTRLLVKSTSFGEKSFWTMLPSPERSILCDKIGFTQNLNTEKKEIIEHTYNLRIGNISIALVRARREVLILTLTQLIASMVPNFKDDSYRVSLKIEGIVLEGSSLKDHLVPVVSSEHVQNSPAYVLKVEFEKMPTNSSTSYKVNGALGTIEIVYHKHALNEIEKYLKDDAVSVAKIASVIQSFPKSLFNFIREKLSKRWAFNFSINIPYLVLPETGQLQKGENVLIIDLGHLIVRTEMGKQTETSDDITHTEMEEQLYSRLHTESSDLQILFCDADENWRDARKEKDTELHILPKTNIVGTYAICMDDLKTIPKNKFNLNMPSIKFNISERKIGLLLKFFNTMCQSISLPSSYSTSILHQWPKDKITKKFCFKYLVHVQNVVNISDSFVKSRRNKEEKNGLVLQSDKRKTEETSRKKDMNEAWARTVDLPGLEDNISPHNNISTLIGFVINEVSLVFSRSSDIMDRAYLMFRLVGFTMDIALMTYGPAYQISLNSLLLTDKLYTTSSGQYLDLIHSPFPSKVDVLTILYRKVAANCPEFWTYFHGVETSLVADIGTLHLLLHQDALHTIIKYARYMYHKIESQTSEIVGDIIKRLIDAVQNLFKSRIPETPVPPGAIKFSHSARLSDVHLRVCDSDFDIINVQFSGLEMDFLFRANERFVFRSYLSTLIVEHLSDVTLYSKVISTDEDKVFEFKYVRNAPHLRHRNDISPSHDDIITDGSFKFYLGRIHITFLYKLVVQLQRFIVNLEGISLIENAVSILKKIVSQATDTLSTSSKIHLAINIHGPVLLFPQKSDSPNVIIFDTGELGVENFFKEYPNEVIENILVKLNDFRVLRGIVGLTSNLEMQETMIEAFSFNFDIKRFLANSRSIVRNLSWEIDGSMDTIQVTLGQRDLSIILAVYTDNIGEGKLLDLIPETIKSPITHTETDVTVKTLEAFFCEPKQKDVSVKFALESIKVLLFFDSGEILSSPIRDLNHGLCKLEISDIVTSMVMYTDQSVDGKLSVDTVLIDEMGPDANIYDKGILQSPVDDNKNNNCNITVNKPPIIDITFHQNKMGDKSVDIIVGRLSLSLSVPFCEKIALFILECIPKDNTDLGIVNHGYVSEHTGDNLEVTPVTSPSLTVAIRINKPEFIFIVETTSNKKRYFITKAEILSDYSRHGNRLSLVLSFSGFHTLFYDLGVHPTDPYVILKRCDLELSKNFTEEKGNKVTVNVSSVNIQLYSKVVHSINDILNDIIEHFKLPEVERETRETKKHNAKSPEIESLWESKKIREVISRSEEKYSTTDSSLENVVHEVLLFPKTEITVVLELEEIPILILKSTVEMTMYNWSSLLNCTCEITVQANYYNENLQTWEPVIDPIVIEEGEYKSWDVLVKIFQDKSLPILNHSDGKPKKEPGKIRKTSKSLSSTEDDESEEDMIYLQPPSLFPNRSNRGIKTSLSTFLEESDSENEDGTMEKIASAISDLFTGDWNESEESDYDHSSEAEDESEENLDIKSRKCSATEVKRSFNKSTYFLIDSKETLNVTITPAFLKLLNDVITMYTNKTLSIISNKKSINLLNDIGPKTVVELFENRGTENIENTVLIHTKRYENEDSCPNSPNKNILGFSEDANEDRDSVTDEAAKMDLEMSYDYEIANTLEFPTRSTTNLYETMHQHSLKIHVPGFSPIQTNCPNKAWQKLMRLQSISNSQAYYLVGKHSIGKHGRTVVVSSPLQIRNETCFALNVLYQPSVLQQLNLEPVGDVTNPFDTTMRIVVLEPHEHYNVPLHIAYHCKLFIQPAYAEGHYASDQGLWWQDLSTELDTSHYILCKPKNISNLEIFSVKVSLKKNIKIQSSYSHSIPNYVIHLLPPLTIQNCLPYSLQVENVELKQHIKVEAGDQASVYSINLSKDQKMILKLNYCGFIWCGTLNLTTDLDEKMITLSMVDAKPSSFSKQLAINVKADRDNNYNLFFYAPYWIVNKTGLQLHIKASTSNTVFESTKEHIVLFSYKRNVKRSINLRVYESSWSNDFGLECTGTTGLVVCKDHERKKKYSFLHSIRSSQICPKFTKVVTLLPSFLVINNTNKFLRWTKDNKVSAREECLRAMEHNEKTDLWIDLLPNQCVTFWPDTSSLQMYVKYRDSKVNSQPFSIAIAHHTVLRMDKGGAITVNVTGGKTEPFHIIFNEYKSGDAPVLIKNMCADLFLKIQQQGQSPVSLLSPYSSLLYTWDDPTKPRQLVWNVYNNKGTGFFIDISKDGYGEEKISFHSVTPGNLSSNTHKQTAESSSSEDSDTMDSVKTTLNKKIRRDKVTIYWLCYYDAIQKTLLFTQEQRIVSQIIKSKITESCSVDFLISLSGIGVSIFSENNPKKELVYVAMSDIPATWEVNVGHKWKTLTLELASWIEDKYRLNYKKCQLKDYVHIDFEKMFMLKPFFAELRRSYNPAVYLQYRKSHHHDFVNTRIQSLQIDNKITSSSDSIILYPLSSGNIKAIAPFMEFVCFRNKTCHIYKHVYLNIEEFYLNLQSEVIVQLSELFQAGLKYKHNDASAFRSEMALIHVPIVSKDKLVVSSVLIEKLHMSKMAIQLNISSRGQLQTSKRLTFPFLNLLTYIFPINLSPYMPAEGVKHAVTPLELTDIKTSTDEIFVEVWQHIKSQLLQQYYSQVLGLQVLVNPYAVQAIPNAENLQCDSEKTANFMLSGCRCLLGHLNMSPAALEQCVADIFTNQSIENIQRIRRHGSYHKSGGIPRSVIASCKNFTSGVTLALDQLIAKNHTGIHYDGEVFFRGTGKALFSLITRHPDEKSDSVQVATQALRRASILGEPVRIHQRPTRYNSYLGLKPFSIYESMGQYLLENVTNCRFLNDTYWAHAAVDKIGKSVVIISLEHVIRVNKCRLWGPWELEWVLDINDVVSVPQITSGDLILCLRQEENKVVNSAGKLTITGDKDMLAWLKEKLQQAMVVSMEDKSWIVPEEQ